MKPVFIISAFLAALFLSLTTANGQSDTTKRGKWSGSASITGGYNYSKSPFNAMVPNLQHQAADTRINLKYIKDNFIATVLFSSAWNNHRKATVGLSLKGEDDLTANWSEIKLMSSRYNFSTNLKWTRPDIIYNAFATASYDYGHNRKISFMINLDKEHISLREKTTTHIFFLPQAVST